MIISKAHWNSDGDNLRLSMPLTKVDKERRIVSGFASLDNVDKQDDIVTAEASMQAFAKLVDQFFDEKMSDLTQGMSPIAITLAFSD
jgi:hypothetical protein